MAGRREWVEEASEKPEVREVEERINSSGE